MKVGEKFLILGTTGTLLMRNRELYNRKVPHYRSLVPFAMEIPHNLTMIGTNYTG